MTAKSGILYISVEVEKTLSIERSSSSFSRFNNAIYSSSFGKAWAGSPGCEGTLAAAQLSASMTIRPYKRTERDRRAHIQASTQQSPSKSMQPLGAHYLIYAPLDRFVLDPLASAQRCYAEPEVRIRSVRASWTYCTTRLDVWLLLGATWPMASNIPEPASALTALHRIGAAFASGVRIR